MNEPIEQIARDLALKLHDHIYGDDDGGHIENDGVKLITESLRQACGQQPVVQKMKTARQWLDDELEDCFVETSETGGPDADYQEQAIKVIERIQADAIASAVPTPPVQQPQGYRELRDKIGEILVRNNLRTDQIAIGELAALIGDRL